MIAGALCWWHIDRKSSAFFIGLFVWCSTTFISVWYNHLANVDPVWQCLKVVIPSILMQFVKPTSYPHITKVAEWTNEGIFSPNRGTSGHVLSMTQKCILNNNLPTIYYYSNKRMKTVILLPLCDYIWMCMYVQKYGRKNLLIMMEKPVAYTGQFSVNKHSISLILNMTLCVYSEYARTQCASKLLGIYK